jgi:hypothetical protein
MARRPDPRSTFAERVLLPIVLIIGMVVAYLDLFVWRPF